MKSEHKKTIKRMDDKWSKLVKIKAGYKSEYSGKTGALNSHHIMGKPNYRLRYELENGMCLTAGEHKYIAHHADRQETLRNRVLKIRGKDFFERMEILKNSLKPDLKLIEIYLDNELKKYGRQQ